ncbi:MAG: Protein translocase subunit SecE [Oscillospiraceae bacterium]|jgi:preprotein translocase subunit SecE
MADKSGKKGNVFVKLGKNISKFFRESKSEAKKMVWPTPQSVFKNTGVVLVTIIVIGLFVFGLDTLLVNLLSLIMNVAG